jgi:transposase InsO family protein
MPRRPRPKAAMPFKAERRHQIWSVDIRYLDMHSLQGIEMVYCISILENFSRSILASAISVRQDTEAFFAVFYAAVRRYGVPEMLVSDNGSIFLSHDTRRVCAQLGIEKKEIKKGKPYQNYIEAALYVIWNLENSQITCIMWTTSAFLLKSFQRTARVFHIIGVQRRMADWSFEKAQTWEDLLAAHDKWMRDYNFQKHMAHEERQDGCHSPAEVLGWIKGMQPEEAVVHEAFSAICETRRLDKAGYAKFRNWSLYGERALAGEITQVNIFQDFLTLEYEQEKLSRYSVEWQLDERHLARVGNPRFYRHPYQSPQQELWQPGEVEWFVIIRNAPPVRRQKRKSRLVVMQLSLLLDGTEG